MKTNRFSSRDSSAIQHQQLHVRHSLTAKAVWPEQLPLCAMCAVGGGPTKAATAIFRNVYSILLNAKFHFQEITIAMR